jgi:hypothetical protein
MKEEAIARSSTVRKPFLHTDIVDVALSFCRECLGWKQAEVTKAGVICNWNNSGDHFFFDPKNLDAVMKAVREWLSAKELYEVDPKYEDIIAFSFGGYFVGIQDQAELCHDLMAACVETRRRET